MLTLPVDDEYVRVDTPSISPERIPLHLAARQHLSSVVTLPLICAAMMVHHHTSKVPPSGSMLQE